MSRLILKLSVQEMFDYVTNPSSLVVDSRIIEPMQDFETILQYLGTDDLIRETSVSHSDMQARLELFRIQYQNNPRNNPGLYGLLDEKTDGQPA